ncbi:methyltransferase domain-containing protein [Blastomonas sp.]|uniref:class I SAM-dependent methyltransferase n=1 Tax=Blastomonas sp. TaxID=1909299 RepID=UPI00260EAF3D|nr:methyltransferase domain-containing protein [Blastomonas sp.]MDM7955670.1 methyltransferase domain-containing protein [Blastomonas sp.]
MAMRHGGAFLAEHMADEIVERLGWVNRSFADALVLGHAPAVLLAALGSRGVKVTLAGPVGVDHSCEEDALPFAPAAFDLVIAIGTLDSVNDLPGALIQINRALRPDGLMMAAMVGAGSLPRLKAAMLAADEASARGVAAHIHPQIDVRAAGDLLQRARFAMPVADSDTLTVRYSSLPALVRDLRCHGWTNVLTSAAPPVGRAGLIAALQNFAEAAEVDGKTAERFDLIYLSGWAPSPDQPKPAKRGSATASLAGVLGKTKPR